MKKLLLSALLLSALNVFSQRDDIYVQDCETLTIGNVGTDLTGTTAGQGNWYTYVASTASPAGSNSNFQVVNAATGGTGKSILLNGTTAAASNNGRLMWQDVASAWTSRTAGNDVAQVEFDLYTGGATTSKNTFRSYIFNAAGQAVAGIYFEPDTKIIKGWAYYDNAGTLGYYVFGLGASGDVVLDPDTWYRVAYSYDYNTGQVNWKEASGLFYGYVDGAAPSTEVDNVDFRIVTSTANTSGLAASVEMDNFYINFDNQETLLGVNSNDLDSTSFNIYPNPTKDIVTISNTDNLALSGVEVLDINGRTVKTVKLSNVSETQINLSDLSAGVYMMKVSSDNGTVTKKIVKE